MSQLNRPMLAMAIAFVAMAFPAAPVAAQSALPAVKPRTENRYLSQEEAAARSARVSGVSYVLDFTLTGEPTFNATSKIDFDLSDKSTPLTVDLDKAQISRLVVNGKTLEPQYNQWFITIASANLKLGRNSVSVSYAREHNTNGEGLHR